MDIVDAQVHAVRNVPEPAMLLYISRISRTGQCRRQRVFENRQVRASRLVMVVIMARWTMASWWSGLVS